MCDCLRVAATLNLDPHLTVALSHCRLAAGGAVPEDRLLSLHLPSALTRNLLPAFDIPNVPSSGAARLHTDPNPTAVPASQASPVPLTKDQVSERRRHVLTSTRFNSSLNLMLCRKIGNTYINNATRFSWGLGRGVFWVFFFFLKHRFQLRPKGF